MAEKSTAGHRQRLRERFLSNEPDSRSEEALLELLLTYSIPRQDVKPLSKQLLDEYGDLPTLLSCAPEQLAKTKGIKDSSIALLKAVDAIASARGVPKAPSEVQVPIPAEAIESPPQTQEPEAPEHQEGSPPALTISPDVPVVASLEPKVKDKQSSAPRTKRPVKVKPATSTPGQRRKFQVSNGYLLEFDQMARVLHAMLDMKAKQKITRADLIEHTGLANRQLESLVSIGCAMGLINSGKQTLSPFGAVVADNDIFIEAKGTLEWCHYVGASSARNLVWHEIFDSVLVDFPPGNQDAWLDRLRQSLEGTYTPRTIGKHLYEEVRFVVDAYLDRNFRKLELLLKSPDEKLYCRRYTQFEPLVLCAMLYDFGSAQGTQLLQVGELPKLSGSPAKVFSLDATTLRQLVGGLHERGWIRYESTHNLDQIRLKSSITALDFLEAHYERRDPQPAEPEQTGELF